MLSSRARPSARPSISPEGPWPDGSCALPLHPPRALNRWPWALQMRRRRAGPGMRMQSGHTENGDACDAHRGIAPLHYFFIGVLRATSRDGVRRTRSVTGSTFAAMSRDVASPLWGRCRSAAGMAKVWWNSRPFPRSWYCTNSAEIGPKLADGRKRPNAVPSRSNLDQIWAKFRRCRFRQNSAPHRRPNSARVQRTPPMSAEVSPIRGRSCPLWERHRTLSTNCGLESISARGRP